MKTDIDLLRDVNVLQAIYWISSALKEVSSDTIEKCFANCGFSASVANEASLLMLRMCPFVKMTRMRRQSPQRWKTTRIQM